METRVITSLAGAVADGVTPDWDTADASATESADRQTIAQLRAIAGIGRVFATFSSTPDTRRSPVKALEAGATWGALRVLQHVGCGRFGDVYRAWDSALDREVALKILRDSEAAGEHDVVHEGRLMARVRHPNVATIHGAQRIDGVTGLWMEFVDGSTLASELAEGGPFGPADLVRVGVQLCDALAAVHEAGLVHRDVKAQNAMRDTRGRIVLGDFGTGRDIDDMAGGIAGTPAYIAPELFARQPATPRSDIYSLGALLFHLATGDYPVSRGTIKDLREAHDQGRRVRLRALRPDLPEKLAQAVDTALDPQPAARFESASDMGRALETSLDASTTRWRSPRVLLAAATAALTVIAAVGFSWQIRPQRNIPFPFAARDWVLIAAFDNRTGESLLDGTLEYALERELAASTFVNVVPRARVEDALQLMRRPANTRIDVAVGQEIAIRDGNIRAVVIGTIGKLEKTYSVNAEILNPADGIAVATVMETAADQGDLIHAISRLAIKIREHLGETLPRMNGNAASYEKVTTSSLLALQLYSQARAMAGEGYIFTDPKSPKAAEPLLRAALKEDPDFTWAAILLAHALKAQDRSGSEILELVEHAAATAAPGIERVIAQGELDGYRGQLTPDTSERSRLFERSAANFEKALQLRPDHFWALSCLLNITENYLGRIPRKERVRQFVELRPKNVRVYGIATRIALKANDLVSAREYALRGGALDVPLNDRGASSASANMRMFAARDALMRRNAADALREADRVAADPRSRLRGAAKDIGIHLAELYMAVGRIDRIERLCTWADPDRAGRSLCVFAAVARDQHEALPQLLRRLFPTRDNLESRALGTLVASAFVAAGMLDEARLLIPVLEKEHAIFLEGELALTEGRLLKAQRLFEEIPSHANNVFIAVRASLKLAEVHTRMGNLSRAIRTLEKSLSYQSGFGVSIRSDAMNTRERLAQLYRQVGRVREAEQIEADLRQVLAVAENDFPMKRRLDRLASVTRAAPAANILALSGSTGDH